VSFYYTKDHLGSIREMTTSSATIVGRNSYDPYGRITEDITTTESTIGFTGMYRHTTSGLNLTLYRAYDPNLGRWISRDPIGEDGGLNLYGYVGNAPINLIDFFGLDAYMLNRELNPGGYSTGTPASNTDALTHTFVYTTNNDGALGDTYSWGNTYDENSNGVWTKNAPEDRDAAQKAINYNNAYDNVPFYLKGVLVPKYGVKVGDSDLDDCLDKAFDEMSISDRHKWELNNNCKHAAQALINLANKMLSNN
jgi:RHS repeat-associated protein